MIALTHGLHAWHLTGDCSLLLSLVLELLLLLGALVHALAHLLHHLHAHQLLLVLKLLDLLWRHGRSLAHGGALLCLTD